MDSILFQHSATLYALFLFSAPFFLLTAPATSSSLAINYGQIADNLPPPESVVPLVKSIGAARLKLYDADPRVLKAFANTGVEFMVGLGNEHLPKMASDPNQALAWVKSNIQCHLPATKITSIAVGNEVLTSNDSATNLLPAMENIHSALISLNLDKQISVTTTHNLGILGVSYPPSAGEFRLDLTRQLSCILDFQCRVGSAFLINAYPYFAYKANPNQIALDFVLFGSGSGVSDPGTGLHYDNMFHAQIDAAYTAMKKLGYGNVKLQISETGWPSKGDADEPGASPENARRYNGKLLEVIAERKGTPMRPDLDLDVYVFALFNENRKPGPTSERNFGLFRPDGTPVYDLGFNVTGLGSAKSPTVSGGSPTGSGGSTPAVYLPAVGGPPNGYLSVTPDDADAKRLLPLGGALLVLCATVSTVLALQF